MSGAVQEKLVDGLTATPFVSLFGYNFMTLNEVLETATLSIGLISAVFALFFHVRRYFRSRKRDQLSKE